MYLCVSVALIRWEWARLVFCIDFLHEVVFVVVLIHSYSVSSVLHEGMVAAVCFSGFLMGLVGGTLCAVYDAVPSDLSSPLQVCIVIFFNSLIDSFQQ